MLYWTASPNTVSYNLKRAGVSGGPYTTIASNLTATSLINTGLVNGTTYYYVVSAVNLNGEGANSVEANATPQSIGSAAYWSDTVTSSAQSWNVNGNWTNTAAFPNAAGAVAVVTPRITAAQTINLNQAITVGVLNLGATNRTSKITLAPNGGSLTFDNTTNGTARLTEVATSGGDTNNAPLTLNSNLLVLNVSNQTLMLAGTISGTNQITFAGPGPVTLGTNNTYGGGTVILGDTVAMGSFATSQVNIAGLASGSVTFSNNGTLQFNGFSSTSTSPDYGFNTNNLVVPTGQVAWIYLPPRFLNGSGNTSGPGLGGNLTGGGTLNLVTSYVRGNISGVWSNFTGQINVWPGVVTSHDFRLGNSGFPNAALYLGSNVTMYAILGNNRTIDIGEWASDPSASVTAGSGGSTAPTWRVGAKNTSATFAGTIGDASGTAIIKVGSGTWILTGANTYIGGTIVSNGTLLVNTSGASGTGAGAVTVASGATLGGNGVIGSPVTITGGGILLPASMGAARSA